MGWVTMHRPKGISEREWLTREEGLLDDTKIRAIGTKLGTTYVAYEIEPGEVIALTILTSWSPNDYFNWGYKPQDETMGVWETDPPRKVLEALTPTENEHALEWRTKSWANVEKRERARKVKKGATVRFAKPIRFTSGTERDTFVFEGRNNFVNGYTRYQIRGWRDLPFEIIEEEAA